MLRYEYGLLVDWLWDLFNACMKTVLVPVEWKNGAVVPSTKRKVTRVNANIKCISLGLQKIGQGEANKRECVLPNCSSNDVTPFVRADTRTKCRAYDSHHSTCFIMLTSL